MSLSKAVIQKKTKKLEEAKKYLKTQFIGIDSCIDKFINSVKIWYILPELQTRPLIVNLWGITGVGKTDLVRKFVNFIDFSDKFCEIQMDSKDGSATIEDYLETTLDHTESGILLLDEIQRFRSVNEKGEESNSTKYQDLWMLLSDGVLQSNSNIKQELLRLMVEEEFWDERVEETPVKKKNDKLSEEEEATIEVKKRNYKYSMFYWEASRLKKLLKLPEDINTIMTYSKEHKVKLIKSRIGSKEIYEGKKYNKLLIIISGNLDEAFKVAKNVDDADLDADVYHEHSKTINIVGIKKALKNRFKPEQIARFGNVHIIYPILNRDSNYKIIQQKIDSISKNINDKHGIDMTFDSSVYDVVYSNGVFPVQGLRPLLSTISSIVENSIPLFLFEHLKKESKKSIVISHKDGKLFSVIEGTKVSYEIPRVLDDIRKDVTKNKLSLIAVHEAGHAVAYAVLNKLAPTQIVASTTGESVGGFIGTHETLGSKITTLNDVIIDYAGRAAEEVVFGNDLITSGGTSDFAHATSRLDDLFRRQGMNGYAGVYIVVKNNENHLQSTPKIEQEIELMAQELYSKAIDLIKNNLEYLMTVSEELFIHKKIEPIDFAKMSKKFVGDIKVLTSGESIEDDFYNIFQAKLKSTKGKIKVKQPLQLV